MASGCRSASLLVMLMLAALVASAQAENYRDVWVQNSLPTKIKCNNHEIEPGQLLLLSLDLDVKVVLAVWGLGGWVEDSCTVPGDVLKLKVVVNVAGDVVVKVVAVVGGLLHQLIGTLLGSILLVVKVVLVV